MFRGPSLRDLIEEIFIVFFAFLPSFVRFLICVSVRSDSVAFRPFGDYGVFSFFFCHFRIRVIVFFRLYGLRGSGSFRTHKRRVKAAPRALLRKGAKRARRQSFVCPTRTRTRSFRPLKVCRSIRTPRARLMHACGAHCGAAVRLRYGAAIMTASPRTEVRGLACVCGRGAVCAAPF